MKDVLLSALEGAGKRPLSLMGERGETIIVLPHGGRVLGLFSAVSDRNFLWTTAAFSSVESTREHFASHLWCNSGGDRTWLAPEIDFFYPLYPDTTKKYYQPRELDPGNFTVVETPLQITLTNEFELCSFRGGWTAPLRITKSIRTTSDPLARGSGASLSRDLEFAGYQLRTSLELLKTSDKQRRIGLWNLLQLPGGGEMIVPLYRSIEPVIYFGNIPAGALRHDDRFVRYRTSAPGEQKIGVDALAVAGRAGYVLQEASASETASLVVRSFAVDASGPYVDAPLHSPEKGGHAFQACNINTDYLGYFAELEYHVPAIGGAPDIQRSDDVSEVWAYRGTPELIDAAAHELLGINLR
ncbi:MAG TPA: hypothetical protein PJ982_07390 [Lacipirellulaceae bacterium]|nr:hypothetical protein [Lacipirellulaceae bacterium]